MHNRDPDLSRRRLLAALALAPAASAPGKTPSPFQLFDGLLHRGKPQLQYLGLRPIRWVGDVWRAGRSQAQVDEEGVHAALRTVPPGTGALYLDVEAWPVLGQSAAKRAQNIRQLLRVAELTRATLPRAQFGFYGLPPAVTYWPLVEDRPAEYADWLESNRLLEPLAAACDFVLPSLYTFYRDRRGWLKYADATLSAARSYGKPVYPFLWFEYHDSNPLLRGLEVDTDAWLEQLRFCRTRADGLVLWGGYQQGWNANAAWWRAVRGEFGLPS